MDWILIIRSSYSRTHKDRPTFIEIIAELKTILTECDLSYILNNEFFELNSARTSKSLPDSGFEKTPLLYPI